MKLNSKPVRFLALIFCLSAISVGAQITESLQNYLEDASRNYQAEKYEVSAKYYRDIITFFPRSSQLALAYQGLGNCYYHLNRIQEAIKAYDQSLALDSKNYPLGVFNRNLKAQFQAKTDPGSDLASDEDKQEIENDIDEIEKEMFHPNWTEQLGLIYSSQPSQTGLGQIQTELDFTGTYHITDSGHYVSAEGGLGKQKVEGASTDYGKGVVEGGLGLGFFQPSLDLQLERGQTALNSNTLTADLNFQLWEPLILGLSLSGTLESHNAPASQVVGTTSATAVQVDDEYGSISALATYTPWDFLGFTLTGEEEGDDTYQLQGLGKLKKKLALNQSDVIDSISLMADITFLKNFELQLTGQTGVENLPAGIVYSRIQAQTVDNTTPKVEPFKGYIFNLLYNFE